MKRYSLDYEAHVFSKTRRRAAGAVCTLILALPVSAHGQRLPDGWRWQLDAPATNVMGKDAPAGAWQLQEMIPGMHVTSGPGVTLSLAAPSAAGRFMVDADIVLFPNSTMNGYGVMFGGQGATSADTTLRTWTAFLVSGAGQFAVVTHSAGKVEVLVPWTANAAVLRRDTTTVTNRLRVWAEPDSVRFVVNGTRVGALPRAAVTAEGAFGLRFDSGMNVHVTNVDITRRLLKR